MSARLGRPVNPTILTRKELAKRNADGNAFVTRVLAQPKLWLIGGEGDLNVDERIFSDLLAACRTVAEKLDMLSAVGKD